MVSDKSTVWELVAEYAATQSGPFTSQEVLSWFRRRAPSKANERTVRTHVRGACWNVGDRSQFSSREPFLTQIDRGLFRSATSDEIMQWRAGPTRAPATIDATADAPTEAQLTPLAEWHTEANVQASLVTALAADGWRILSVADTATKEHGIDVIATRDGQTVGIEVKGYPSRDYADPKRAGEVKRSSPTNQAGHWYAQAVLAAMRLRGKEPTWRSVIVLPDFPRYRTLFSETATSLAAAEIEVWWLDQFGHCA